MKLNELLESYRPFLKAKVAGSVLAGVLGFAAILTWADREVERRYIQSGGDINNSTSNYEKIQYIRSHDSKENSANYTNNK